MIKSKKVPHVLPKDLMVVINKNPKIKYLWNDITPLARNEFVCFIISAKKSETRVRRIERVCEDLLKGKRRPCCFAGCAHRTKNR